MKRLLSLAVATVLAGQAWAATTFTVNGLKYTVTNETNHTVSVSKGSAAPPANLVIPSEVTYSTNGEKYTVTAIGNEGFRYCSNITSLSLPGTIITIGNLAFDECSKLTAVVIPNSVKTISDNAFRYCSELASVTLGNSVTSIGYDAFRNTKQLVEVTIPKSVTTISYGIFCECPKLTTINVEEGSSSFVVENGALYNAAKTRLIQYPAGKTDVESFVVAETVTSIDNNAFASCKIKEIIFPKSLTSIGSWAFTGCGLLQTVTIQSAPSFNSENSFYNNKVTTLTVDNDDAISSFKIFSGVTTLNLGKNITTFQNVYSKLTAINVDSENPNFSSENGILLNKDQTELICCPSGLTGDFTIPSTVTSIGDNAFKGCTGLTSITIPKSVTSISPSAFAGCGATLNLDEDSDFLMENGVLFNKDKTVLVGCYEPLTGSYSIPNTVKSVGSFAGCTGLTSIEIPESVESFESGAFTGCTGLTSVITNSNADYSSANLCFISEGIKYRLLNTSSVEVASNSYTNSIIIPESVTAGNEYAVTRIGDNALNSTKLKSITIPNSITSIGTSAFPNSLTSVTTDNDIIDYNKAGLCIKKDGINYKLVTKNTLQVVANGYSGNINIPETFTAGNDFTVVSISAGAFRERVVALKSVVIPNTVDSIAAESFYRDMEMTSVIIGNSVKSIGDNAFYDCTSLTTITIPNSVTKIGKGAFRFCHKLDTIIISNSLTSIGDGAFYSQGEGNPSAIITESDADFSNADIYFTKDEIRYRVLTKNTVEISYVFNLTGDVVIPTTVTAGNTFTITSIGDYALENKTNITSITIPNTVTKIGKEAFRGCSGLTKAKFASMESLLAMEFGSTLSNPIYLAKHLYIENKEVTNLVIPDSVTSIGTKFRNCCGLTSVTIPNSVTEIRNNAFDGCSGLTSINIPESVTTIGDKAFNNCSGLISVTIPKSVTNIGNNAFLGCSSVETLTYNTNAVGSIFKGIKTLKTVNIGNSVTNVPDEAFNGCSELASITIPDAVTSIGARAFYGCSGVKSITIPNSVTTIGSYAFNGCNNVETLSYNTRAIGTIFKGMKKLKTVIIGDSITSIAAHMFNGCSSLTSVTIPNSVKTIGQQAFDNCTSLDLLIVPDSVVSIGSYAFEDVNTVIYSGTATGRNWGAQTVLSNAVTDGDWLYSDSTKTVLVKYMGSGGAVTIPNTVKSIENGAFRDCTGLTSVTISDSVKSIGFRAFDGCTNLAFNEYNNACYLGNSKNRYLALIKPQSEDIKSCSVNSKCQIIANKAFLNCSLTSITIPESVTVIGDDAFDGCTELTSISISSDANIYPANICFTKGGIKYRVLDKESVEVTSNSYSGDITIPENVTAGKTFNVTSIGDKSFYNCANLTSITIPNTVTRIGEQALSGCSSITEVSIPNSVIIIEVGAFSVCKSLVTVTIPNSVTSIGGAAFYNCSNLTSVVIPNSVTEIGEDTFEGCSNLSSVVIPNSVTKIGYYAFSDCSSLTSVVVPNTVSSIGSYAFKDVGEVIYSGTASGSKWGANSVVAYSSGFKFKVNENNPNEAEVTKYEGTDDVVVIPPTVEIDNKTYTVTSISESAFSSCWELKAVYLPNTITSIGATSFSGCYKLQFNTFDNAIYVGSQDNPYYALIKAKDKNITSCQIHSDCKVIASFAFENCEALTSITIPDSVTHIGRMAFNNCSAIENAVVGKSIVEIGNWAFENCKKLKTVSIPTSIKSIGYGVFYGCDNLQYNTFDNALYLGNDVNKYVVLMMPKADDIQQCVISDSCQIIYESAFLNCAALDSVSIPNSVWSIGSNAFSNTALRSVVLPDSLRTIEAGLFNECTKLTSVTIPNSVTTIGINAFYWCESLKTVALPNGLTQIGGSAFNYCLGLDSILIPMSVDSIGNAAFFRGDKATIYCEADSKPAHWDEDWNKNGGTVVWKYCGNGNNAHTSVTDAAVAATCTKSGLTEGSHCSVCGTVIVKQDTIPAKGHTIVIDEAVEPTCTETGLGEGKHCAVCDEYDWTQELLPPLGHEFVNYVYNNDATTEADGTETAVCERGCGATDTRIAEGTKLATAISESAAGNLMVHAHGNVIIVENATDEIRVYDAMGKLICRDAINRVRAEITVNTTGIYIVKTGNTVKRVSIQ